MSRSLAILFALLAVMLGCGLLWQWLAMQDILTPQALLQTLQNADTWRDTAWAPLAVMGIYALTSLVIFPLSLLVAVTGLVFGPAWGFAYAMLGTLSASIATYWVGRALGRDALLRHGGQKLNGLARLLAGRGVRTMVLFNLLPLAPFTLTNMLAGACHLRFREYMLGSTLGIAPGLLGVTLLGSQLGSLVTAESREGLLIAAGGIVVAVGILWGLKRYAERRSKRG
ncbi:putative membrane protein YdjX (TVP38/TMEM64 family) [Chromohalobacter marismortui]|uniref:TVP38/TMEM64 family membrane protein n=1 Tax=Chromohalobacter marismortui TaxID=42055 RepID=A0A4R7NM70_9GAMM|nr:MULTISPECIES: TVP38/TMEM64 family protein [Chromohalobacter]MCI0510254.1 TVP38/TMEM64 family protein [Chromohalobacter sp.]MCI0593430.1 TVP38/TMEM64 family protein [Chromohalobacter sp.]TDU21672.1 putative membrane protein YdjX (TVP38/TMEM64 family) [Chromohalobacter marismortui]